MTVANSKRKSTQLLPSLNLTAPNPSSYFIPITMSDLHREGDKHKHGGEVNRDHRFKVVVLIVVGAEADDVEDGGGDKDVEEDAKKFSTKSDRHSDSLHILELHHLVAYSMLAKEMALPQFWFPVYHTSSALEVHRIWKSLYSFA